MIAAPFDEYRDRVREDWIDENDHMNVGYYGVVFDAATDAWFGHIGIDTPYREAHAASTFTLESHMLYLREVLAGDPLRFTTQLLAFDAKRIHYIHAMYHGDEGYLASTCELMSLHVSRETRRAAPLTSAIQERLTQLMDEHRQLDKPPQVGRVMGVSSGRAR